MTAAKPPVHQRALGALASGIATAELHHQAGHDRGAPPDHVNLHQQLHHSPCYTAQNVAITGFGQQ